MGGGVVSLFSVLEAERGERVVMVMSVLGRTVLLSSVSTVLEDTMATLAWLLLCEFTRLKVLVSTGREVGGGKSINNEKYSKWLSDSRTAQVA